MARSLAIANLVAVAALAVLVAAPMVAAAGPVTRTLDVYDPRAALWQDPDKLACTSAAAQMMLNLVAYEATAEYFAPARQPRGRAGSTLAPRHVAPDDGVDARLRALEHDDARVVRRVRSTRLAQRPQLLRLGLGQGRGVRGSAYPSFDEAARAVVVALAESRPVGILARAGGHAQLVTGFVVSGEDPRAGGEFTILGVYVTDPLLSAGMRDAFVSLDTWRSGASTIRFAPYLQADSPFRDAIDGNAGTTEWYGKWVVVEPVA